MITLLLPRGKAILVKKKKETGKSTPDTQFHREAPVSCGTGKKRKGRNEIKEGGRIERIRGRASNDRGNGNGKSQHRIPR